ncbi:peptide deformylase [Wohlfahrtiimonas chitiniclastica]|uniref:peptide deformylase n=1 Tax=Wohlfahrtiimonas chitiniclastica TaxID=400946 RepID=UPI000B97D61D|nr:peptide deformylase [Wohlfahrtiimonas chitiniclastica]OYQ82599.1 peptide deformylase [Wohlfahrtiimonas chitiniclastica]
MSKLDVIYVPHETLRQTASVVTTFDKDLYELANGMLETMYENNGIGLAANQVNDLRRIFVTDCTEEKNDPMIYINPEIIWESENVAESEEGCLSLPSIYSGPIERPFAVKIRAQDIHGDFFEREAEDLLARCMQHELDHLNGILFIDYLSRLKRERALKKLEKYLKDMEKKR